ncbi:hypothetical protein MAPG_11833 [Magnaporthiopsis poae ATCC 64411]|uniref:Heterokaryon incompatibility domain-containing protein n=1 Tax=Magnaporthiopsis poae (strain ATCC 64411 / 73-15) TaxID=644358 RepID=A0A0C4EGA5_MAGP6|nr:hypothetical protein MAPG_11833 [Magnaporthiopsis poae ATCC 64411]
MEGYKDRLHSDFIRVLRLHPGDDADIKVSITTVQLSAKPSFIALSYTWGNPLDEHHPSYQGDYDNVKHHLCCTGERLPVGRNLYETLQQLLQGQESSPLWIDAMCINQNDPEEISHQLSLMPRIYDEASQVVVWLGKEDPTAHEAIQTLDGLQCQILEATFGGPTSGLSTLIPVRKRRAVANLFRRRWFSRVWTLQEAVLPARIRYLCGPYNLEADVANMFASVLLRDLASAEDASKIWESYDKLPIGQLSAAACIGGWRGVTWSGGGFDERAFLRYPKIDCALEVPRTLKWLVTLELYVHETRPRNCQKPEDKVRAPLAFALNKKFTPTMPEFHLLERHARQMLDCRIPWMELYPMFTQFIIDSMANLDILSRAHRDVECDDATEMLSLPSWVPPFQAAGTTSLIDDLLFTKFNAASYLGAYRVNDCRTGALELPVRATFFGRVAQISTHAAPADSPAAWFSHVRKSERFQQEIESRHCRDLAHVAIATIGDDLERIIKWEAERERQRQPFLRGLLSMTTILQINTSVSRAAMRRLFYFDVNGYQSIGLGPQIAQVSDHLCVLQGAKVPVILRETPEPGKYNTGW